MTIKVQPPNPMTVHTPAPCLRFGGSGLERSLYPIADTFLSLPQKVGGKSWFSRALSTILDQDYREMAKLPVLGRVVVEPPMGALVVLLFGFTLGGRLSHAIHRAVGGDKRELRDIVFRDIPTFSLILFALKPMVKVMSDKLQKIKGIQLVHGKQVFGYSELDDIYKVLTVNRLKAILANPQNHKGLLAAIDKTMANPSLSPTMKSLLRDYKRSIAAGIQIVAKNGGNPQKFLEPLEPVAQKAFNILKQLESQRGAYLRKMESGANVASKPLLQKLSQTFQSKIPAFNTIFSSYAKGSRVWANAAAYAMVIGLLGFGVTAFNQWFTEREYKKLQSQKPQQPQLPNNFDVNAFIQALQPQNTPNASFNRGF